MTPEFIVKPLDDGSFDVSTTANIKEASELGAFIESLTAAFELISKDEQDAPKQTA